MKPFNNFMQVNSMKLQKVNRFGLFNLNPKISLDEMFAKCRWAKAEHVSKDETGNLSLALS